MLYASCGSDGVIVDAFLVQPLISLWDSSNSGEGRWPEYFP